MSSTLHGHKTPKGTVKAPELEQAEHRETSEVTIRGSKLLP